LTLTNLIACYTVLAYNMNTYELEAPEHATEPALAARSLSSSSTWLIDAM
jgi:hypothetical protein